MCQFGYCQFHRALNRDTGDSIVSEYATHCDGAFECRNLKQLERFVEHLA